MSVRRAYGGEFSSELEATRVHASVIIGSTYAGSDRRSRDFFFFFSFTARPRVLFRRRGGSRASNLGPIDVGRQEERNGGALSLFRIIFYTSRSGIFLSVRLSRPAALSRRPDAIRRVGKPSTAVRVNMISRVASN